ncbi:MAG: DUF2905 domain-containing protein [Candidatus Lambdaproteobacteria bacterium]|nr:DUF2905 domain-containing protein [Candidatus Lambdaproteobacteria bacterium]
MELSGVARFLILAGVVLVALGVVLLVWGRIPWLGRLPGNIVIRREGFTFSVPLATSLLLSALLSLLLWLLRR